MGRGRSDTARVDERRLRSVELRRRQRRTHGRGSVARARRAALEEPMKALRAALTLTLIGIGSSQRAQGDPGATIHAFSSLPDLLDLPVSSQAAPPPATDIYELTFDGTLAGLKASKVQPVSTAPGYDNQPAYTADGAAILFTANR